MKTKKRLLSILLTLALVLGMMPGMSMTAYADDEKTYTIHPWQVGFNQDYGKLTTDAVLPYNTTASVLAVKVDNGINWYYAITSVSIDSGSNVALGTPTGTPGVKGYDVPVTINGEGEFVLKVGRSGDRDPTRVRVVVSENTAAVEGVNLNSTSATLTVGDSKALTATVVPEDAADKKVIWSVGGTNASAVTLYSDSSCNTPIGSDATSTRTVYAKGTSVGDATVTVTATNGTPDTSDDKTATCSVTVSKGNPTAPTGLVATYGQTLADVTLPDGWTWADSTQSVGDVVSPAATFKANFAGNDNYNAASNVDVTVTVNKADPAVPTGVTATYGQTLADVALPDGWTWADSTQSVGNVVSPAETFKANFAGNDNYNAASNVDVTVTVNPVDKTELNEAIDAAQAAYDSIKDIAAYQNTANSLKAGIDDAKLVAENDNAEESAVSGAITQINQIIADAEETISNGFANELSNIGTDDIEAGKKALDFYNSLPDAVKEAVDKKIGRAGTKKLADLEKALDVYDKIDTLKAADQIALSDENEITLVRTAYELLTDSQKDMIPQAALDKLEAAEQKIANLKAADALEAAKAAAIDRLDDYSAAKALSDATEDEKKAYDDTVAAERVKINAATDKDAVAAALANAKQAVDAALAAIEADRAAAEAMASADQAVADAKASAESAEAAADEAAADAYATDADKNAISEAKADVKDAVDAANALSADATAAQKNAAAKAIEDAVQALNAATDTANVNSAAARAAAGGAATAAEQLAAAKASAIDRLDDYSEAKALSDATEDEKKAYDDVVAAEKVKINAAADKDAVAAALANAKKAVDDKLAEIEADRAAAAAAEAMAAADQAIADAKASAESAEQAADEAAEDTYATDADRNAISGARTDVEDAVKAANELPADATAAQKNAAAQAIEDAVQALNTAIDTAKVNSAAARAAAEGAATAAEQLAAAKASAIDRLDDYSDAKARADATEAEKKAYDDTIAAEMARINAAETKEAVAAALTAAKKAVDDKLAEIQRARDLAAAKEVMSEVSAKTDLIYTGNPIQLINAPTKELPKGYVMKYAVTTENTAPADDLYDTSIPAATNAGTYYVWYKAVGDDKHTDADAESVAVTIAPTDKAALNQAIADAQAYYDTIKDNEQYADVANALKTAIETAQAVAGNDNATDTAVAEAVQAMGAAADAARGEVTDIDAAKTVKDMIDALPKAEDVKSTDKDAIETARAAYGALTEDQKKLVSADALANLETAEAALQATLSDEEATQAVDAEIAGLPDLEDVKAADKDAIEAARRAYDALTDDQKKLVSADTLAKLEAAEAALQEAVEIEKIQFITLTTKGKNAPETVTMGRRAIVVPKYAVDQGWTVNKMTSSSRKVADIDPKTGELTMLKAGKTTISVKAKNGKKSVNASVKLTVVDPAIPTAIRIDQGEEIAVSVGKADNCQLTVTAEPVETASSEVTWKSSKKSVVDVDENGKLTPKKTGKATITATSKKDRKRKAKITVNVVDQTVPTGIALSTESGSTTLAEGEFIQLKYALTGPDAEVPASSEVTWKSRNTKIATVSGDGLVTAKKPGTVEITAKTKRGNVPGSITLTVQPAASNSESDEAVEAQEDVNAVAENVEAVVEDITVELSEN